MKPSRLDLFPLVVLLASCCPPAKAIPAPTTPAQPPTADATNASAGDTETKPTDSPAAAPPFRLGDRVVPIDYEIELTLDPKKDTFSGVARIQIEIRQATDHLWLHGHNLKVDSASLRVGNQVPYPADLLATESDSQLGFAFGREVTAGKATLEVKYTGKVDDKGYFGVFRQEYEKRWYLFTQFETTFARRAFPCFDEPGFKVPWQLTLRVPRSMTALSNTPVEAIMKAENDQKAIRFARTRPLPSYLVAFAVGPFDIVKVGEVGRAKTPVRLIVPRGKSALAKFSVKSVRELHEILEAYFDMPYPYAKLDHIVVPRFFGGMENQGLITYDAGILLVEPGKEGSGFLARHGNVVAHEIAHQWFGDLVTLAWWNDIWLNESFASWLAAKAFMKWRPKSGGFSTAVAFRSDTMTRDGMVSARKVRQPVDKKADMSTLFDDISYVKGGAVLWMFERWVGEKAFRDGVRRYIRRHADGSATSADFLAAIGEVSRAEVPSAFATFLDQPGVPLVSLDLVCEKGNQPAASLAQERYLPAGSKGSRDQTWQIPVCLKYGAGKAARTQCTLLSEKRTRLALDKAKRCPRWIMANADAAGYYRVGYGAGLLRKLLTAGAKQLSTAERVVVIGDMDALVNAGKLGAGEALSHVPKLVRGGNRHMLGSALGIVSSVDAHLVPDRLRPNYARFIRKTFGKEARKLGWTPPEREDAQSRELRPALVGLVATRGRDKALLAEADKLAARWLDTKKGVHPDMLGAIMGTAAERGDAKLHGRIFAAAKKTDDRRQRQALLAALGAFRDPALIQKNLEIFMSGELDMKEAVTMFTGMQHPTVHRAAYQFVKANFDTFVGKMPAFARGYAMGIAAGFCDEAGKKDAQEFLGERAKKLMSGEKVLASSLERVELCIARRKAQQPSVEKFLKRY